MYYLGEVLILFWLTGSLMSEDMCWSTFGDYQYMIVTTSGGVIFEDASSGCARRNAMLASVHSKEEDLFLRDFVMSEIAVPVWIGLRRNGDTLSWVDGTPVDYVDSAYKRKSSAVSCSYMFQGWIDEHCLDAELYYICKRQFAESGSCFTTTIPPPTTTQASTPDVTTEEATTPEVSTGPLTTVEDTTVGTPPATTSDDVRTDVSVPEFVSSDDISTVPTISATTAYTITEGGGEQSTPDITSKAATYQNVTSKDWEVTFEKMLADMTVKEKPVYKTTEAFHSKTIGSVSCLILVCIILGVVLLDLSTIKKHLVLLRHNTKGVCEVCGRRGKNIVNLQGIEMGSRHKST